MSADAYDDAVAHMARWELDAADRLLERCVRDPELRGIACYERAILADLRGDRKRADRLFREAAALEPRQCPLPVRMRDSEAQALLREVVESMPDDVRGALENVSIEIVPMPDPRRDARDGLHPDLLGLYEGVPITEESDRTFTLPGRIRIFKRNIERLATNRDGLIRELRITLLHEIGHHLGWDEAELHARGLG